MTLNNRCRSLIVYGSHAPGGANYDKFAHLNGNWQKGKILKHIIEGPDEVGPGETDEVEAWVLDFEADFPTLSAMEWPKPPAEKNELRKLFDLWTSLDDMMGAEWGRSEERWWPEHCKPVVSGEMSVRNIYLPVKHFPYLTDPDQPVHPNDEDNIEKLWQQVVLGEKKYEWDVFRFLLSDTHPDRFQHLFGNLPDGHGFIDRLNRIVDDLDLAGSDPAEAYKDHQNLGAGPTAKTLLPLNKLIPIVEADLAQRQKLLKFRGEDQAAAALSTVSYVAGNEDFGEIDCDAGEALEMSGDIISGSKTRDDTWLYCLSEACYGMTGSLDMRH